MSETSPVTIQEAIKRLEAKRIGFVGKTLVGDPVIIRWEEPIEHQCVSTLTDIMFNATVPFYLFGNARIIGGYCRLNCVDLYYGGRFDLDIYLDMLRVYLRKGTHGASVLRLCYNLERHIQPAGVQVVDHRGGLEVYPAVLHRNPEAFPSPIHTFRGEPLS